MPNPCSAELDAIMLGEALPLHTVGKQWEQPVNLETWTNGNDIGLQHEQWRLDTKQELVLWKEACGMGRGGFRAKLKMGQAGIDLCCYPIRATKTHLKIQQDGENYINWNVYSRGTLHGRTTWKPLGVESEVLKGEAAICRAFVLLSVPMLN